MRGAYRRVPPQRGLVGEGSAAGVAHEGLLAGVDAVVPLQRVQLRELLPALVAAVGPLACRHRGSAVKATMPARHERCSLGNGT